MSRFTAPSTSRSLIACAALVTVLTLSACGRDDAESAGTGDTAAQTTPQATTPATTPAQGDTNAAPEPADTKTDTVSKDPQSVREAERLSKKDPDTNPAPTSPTGKVKAALQKGGYDVSAYGATGQASSSLKVGPLMSVVFYDDAKSAKVDYGNFKAAFSVDGAQGAAIRRDKRVYLIATPNATTPKQKRELRKVSKIAEAALR